MSFNRLNDGIPTADASSSQKPDVNMMSSLAHWSLRHVMCDVPNRPLAAVARPTARKGANLAWKSGESMTVSIWTVHKWQVS